MGNFCFYQKKKTDCITDEDALKKYNMHQSTGSISNISTFKSQSDLDKLDGFSSLHSTSSLSFSWSRMQAIYLEYTPNKYFKMELAVVKELLEALVNDDANIFCNLQDSIELFDKTYLLRFEQCAGKNDNMKPSDRMIKHLISLLHLHLKIVKLLIDNNNERVLEIIKQIAISHMLMKVPASDFRLMDMALGKFLLKNDYVHYQNFQSIIVYLNTMTDLISKQLERGSSRLTFIMNLSSDMAVSGFADPRENYRTMKKWKRLVESLDVQYNPCNNFDTANWKGGNYSSDVSTIATEDLKKEDFIMKLFANIKAKRKPNS